MKLFMIAAILALPMLSRSQQRSDDYTRTNTPASECLRVVDGKLYNACKSELWHAKVGRVYLVLSNGIICNLDYTDGQLVALKNYPIKHVVDGDKVRVMAIRTGEFKYGANTIEKWDCGILYSPPSRTNSSTAAASSQP